MHRCFIESGGVYSLDRLCIRSLRQENVVLRAAFLDLRIGSSEKFAFIEAHCSEFRVEKMCEVLGVSRSGFYKWRVSHGRP